MSDRRQALHRVIDRIETRARGRITASANA